MTPGRVGVLGAGPAGLGAARTLALAGTDVTVYERSSHVGGLARSFELWGQLVELGPHLLLRDDPRIDRLWDELIGQAYVSVPRETRIVAGRRSYRYPYEPLDVVKALGVRSSARCVLDALGSYLGGLRSTDREDSLEAWIVSRFGRRGYELLAAEYLLKLFGLDASELEPALAGSLLGFQRQPSLATAARSVLRRPSEQQLVRPVGGAGALSERLAKDVVRLGGEIRCDAVVEQLRIEDGRVRGVYVDDELDECDCVISTVPLPVLVGPLTKAPEELQAELRLLQARSVIIVYALFPGPSPFTGQWLYVTDLSCPVARITNYSGWTPVGTAPPQSTILSFELWCDPTDEVWSLETQALQLVVERALLATGLRAPPAIDVTVLRRQKVFPVVSLGSRGVVAAARDWISTIEGLYTAGRFGAFANTGVHESLLMGIESAQAVLAH